MRVLVVEDDARMRELLERGLREQGFDVLGVGSASEGWRQALYAAWNVIVLDVNLPDGDGFTFCRELRAHKLATPVLMLTARDTVDDRVTGLESGGDDYLVKPCSFRELVARVWALARRPPILEQAVAVVADLEVNFRTREIRRDGNPICLTSKEFTLLECLLRSRGAVVNRAHITKHVWDDNHDPFANVLEVLVRRLRAKVDDPFRVKLIHTVRGVGYRLSE